MPTFSEEQAKAVLNSESPAKKGKKSTKQAHAEAAATVGSIGALTGANLADLDAIARQFRQVGQAIGLTAIHSMHAGVADVFNTYQQHGGIQFLVAQVGDRAASLPEAGSPRMLPGATEADKNEAIAAIEALFTE